MWELGYKETWAPKNWCFWTVILEKTLESPLDYKEIQPVHSKGNQSWIFIGRTDAEAETTILWPPVAKNWLLWKSLMLGKIEGGSRRGWQRMRWLDGITNSMDMNLSNSGSWWWTGRPGMLQSMGLQRVGHCWAAKLNWTEHRKIKSKGEISDSWCRGLRLVTSQCDNFSGVSFYICQGSNHFFSQK